MNNPLVLKPRVSEKAYALSQQTNTYVFDVMSKTNKQSIAQAVTLQYEVGVEKVRIAAAPAKKVRRYKRGGRVVHRGERSGFHKAYVTLKKGDSLPLFASVDDSDDKNEKGDK